MILGLCRVKPQGGWYDRCCRKAWSNKLKTYSCINFLEYRDHEYVWNKWFTSGLICCYLTLWLAYNIWKMVCSLVVGVELIIHVCSNALTWFLVLHRVRVLSSFCGCYASLRNTSCAHWVDDGLCGLHITILRYAHCYWKLNDIGAVVIDNTLCKSSSIAFLSIWRVDAN